MPPSQHAVHVNDVVTDVGATYCVEPGSSSSSAYITASSSALPRTSGGMDVDSTDLCKQYAEDDQPVTDDVPQSVHSPPTDPTEIRLGQALGVRLQGTVGEIAANLRVYSPFFGWAVTVWARVPLGRCQ